MISYSFQGGWTIRFHYTLAGAEQIIILQGIGRPFLPTRNLQRPTVDDPAAVSLTQKATRSVPHLSGKVWEAFIITLNFRLRYNGTPQSICRMTSL